MVRPVIAASGPLGGLIAGQGRFPVEASVARPLANLSGTPRRSTAFNITRGVYRSPPSHGILLYTRVTSGLDEMTYVGSVPKHFDGRLARVDTKRLVVSIHTSPGTFALVSRMDHSMMTSSRFITGSVAKVNTEVRHGDPACQLPSEAALVRGHIRCVGISTSLFTS